MVDYNVTCPDYRFCQVRHTYANPCEIWDCDACWWHYSNCTKTPEAASDDCPYIYKCSDLPHPHSHVTTTVVTTLTVLSVFGLFGTYAYRRWRRGQVAEREGAEGQEETERTPLLQRCRALVSASLPSLGSESTDNGASAFARFHAVIFGARADVAPPEDPVLNDREDLEPSAPPEYAPGAPPSYEEVQEDDRSQNPIIRPNRVLTNENYAASNSPSRRSVEMREISSSPRRSPTRMEEVPLSNSLH